MNILQIAPQIPYPLLDGGKVGIYNITKHLALRGHSVTLATFQRKRDTADLGELKRFCTLVAVPHETENIPFRAALNIVSSLPYNISKYQTPRFRLRLSGLLAGNSFDIVHVDHLHMAPYGLFCRTIAGIPVVLREHNIESMILARYAGQAGSTASKWFLGIQKQRIRRFESEMAASVDRCCVISEEDRKKLLELQPSARIRVISAGVDDAYFDASPDTEVIPDSICYVGSLDWGANQDAVRWLVGEIMPEILKLKPSVRLRIIGKGAPDGLLRLGGEHVEFRGFVPDLKSELRRHRVCVVPLRIGGGIRLKILESFAMNVPVVSTSVGCEGLPVTDGRHLLIGNTPRDFGHQVVRLLENPALGNSLKAQAYDFASRYRWGAVAEQFEAVYREICSDVR